MLCSVSRLAFHRAAMPNIFLSSFIFLLACFRRLSTLLPPLYVILVFTMVFVYYCNMCLKLWLDNVYFLSSHGSSLIGMPLSPSCCLPVVFVHVTRAVFWFRWTCAAIEFVVTRAVNLLPTTWWEIFCSSFSLDVLADGRV